MSTLETISELIIDHIRSNDRDVEEVYYIKFEIQNEFVESKHGHCYFFKFSVREKPAMNTVDIYICLSDEVIFISDRNVPRSCFDDREWVEVIQYENLDYVLNIITDLCRISICKVKYQPYPG